MSWLNLNESLNSLKGQITNFATEVLSEGVVQDPGVNPEGSDHLSKQLEEKCQNQELEIAALKQLTEDLQSTLQAELISRKNGVKEDESNWYWDPPTPAKPAEDVYNLSQQIQSLKNELASAKASAAHNNDEDIKRLKEENKHLTVNLEDLDNQHQQAMERLLSLKKELQKNFEVLKQEHEDLKTANEEYENDIKSLSAKLAAKDKEIEIVAAVKSDHDTLHHKYQNLERIHSLLRENAENFQEENQEIHEENFKLQEQVTKLEHELELAKNHIELSNAVPRETYNELLKDFNDLKERRNSNDIHQDEMNIDDNAKSVIENLKRDISELKHKLAHKKSDMGDSDDTHVIKSDKVMHLYNKYVNFELPVDYVGEMPASGGSDVLFKIENAFKALFSFKKEIDSLGHSITEKNRNINHMQTQIDDITSENDFLTSDIQHYERELNEMKKNNDFLISEIAALKNTSKLEPISETHEDNFSKLENELADSNKMNKSFKCQMQKIEKELEEVKTEKVSLQSALDDLKRKYTSMLTELDSCKNQTKDIVDLESSLQHFNSEKVKQYTDEIDSLKKRLITATNNNEKLTIDMHIIENDKVLLTKEVSDSKHKFVSTKRDLENKVIELEEQLSRFSCSKTEDDDRKALQDMIKDLQNNLQTALVENSKNINADLLQFDKISADNATLKESLNILSKEVEALKHREQELLVQLNNEKEQSTSMKKMIEGFKSNSEQVKAEIRTITERKLEVEAELTATDKKIFKLEEEFEKLVQDLNDKDTIIDSLNATIAMNNASLSNFTQNVIDLENSVAIKNEEIEKLRKDSTDVIKKLNHLIETSNKAYTEYENLMREKEEISIEMTILQDHINTKNAEISELKYIIDELKKKCQQHKMYSDQKDKEIKELNQLAVETTDKMRSNDTAHQNNECDTLTHERNTIAQQVNDLSQTLKAKDDELKELKSKSEGLERTCAEYKEVLENANREKTELVNLITLKHNESIQYHNEIQRLNHVLLEQSQNLQKVEEEKDSLLQNQTCQNCENLRMALKEKDEVIMVLNENKTASAKGELTAINESVKGLTEKCNSLEKNLAIQVDTVKRLSAENLQLQEQVSNSSRELDRLRQHLVTTEETYTQELMISEQKLNETQTRLQQLEERSKQHSTVYTSNSIRANQEVETLRNQIRLLEKQREEVQAKLAGADDARNRSEAALTNLQLVLEQFQLDKERDIEAATVKLQNKMAELQKQNGRLQQDLSTLAAKLEESYAGLQAASRLGDQLENKTAVIQDLREQVRTLQTTAAAAEERYHNTVSHQQDKVDKNLVKNLVVNLHSQGQGSNRTQVLRILSSVLDFNQQECERLGLARATASGDSLAQEFVKFLQKESQPAAPLPNMMSLAGKPAPARRNSGLGPQPNPYNAGHSRTPSSSSNNLLLNAAERDALDAAPAQLAGALAGALAEGVNQTRNTEGAILKQVLKDM